MHDYFINIVTGPSPAETTRHASQRVTYHETLTLHNATGFHALSIRLAVVLEEDGSFGNLPLLFWIEEYHTTISETGEILNITNPNTHILHKKYKYDDDGVTD